jgi:hypothetical protein
MAQGTFGICIFDSMFATKVSKRLPNSFNYREAEFLEKAKQVVESLELKMVRVPLVHEYWVKSRKHYIRMDRIIPPMENCQPILCKFWGSFDNYDENWKTMSFDDVLGNNSFGFDLNHDSLCKLAHDLGQFHRGMMELGVCVWEVEIMIGKLVGEDHLSFFLIDFDKAGIIDFAEKNICNVKSMGRLDVARMLVQESYPKPGSDLFTWFLDGFTSSSSSYTPNYSIEEINSILNRIPKN